MQLISRYLLVVALFAQILPLVARESGFLDGRQAQLPARIVTPEMLALANEVQLADCKAIVKATKELIAFNPHYKVALTDYSKVMVEEWNLTKKQYKMLLMFFECVQRCMKFAPQLIMIGQLYAQETARLKIQCLTDVTNGKAKFEDVDAAHKKAVAQLDKDPRFALFQQIKAEFTQLATILMPLLIELQAEMQHNGPQADKEMMAGLQSWLEACNGVFKINVDALKTKIASMPE